MVILYTLVQKVYRMAILYIMKGVQNGDSVHIDFESVPKPCFCTHSLKLNVYRMPISDKKCVQNSDSVHI